MRNGLRIATRYVENHRDPTVVELYLPFPVANPNLRSEQSSTTELTVGWRPAPRLEVEVTGYRTLAHDYIRTLGAYPAFERANIDRVDLKGIEALVRARIWGPFSMRLTGAPTDVGPYTAQTPARTATGSLLYDDGTLRIALTWFYAGGLYQMDFRQGKLADPWELGARVDRVFDKGKVRAWITARNLTNHRYAFIADYPMPGFNTLVGLELVR